MGKNTYSSYLLVNDLLAAQRQKTDSDDELLFIIIHQAHELWFKLAIHEISCAIGALMRERVNNSDCILAFKRLSRVSEIQKILVSLWDVLTTLTPDEFTLFRQTVGADGASGFQSVQYRVLEFRLGLKYREVEFSSIKEDGSETKKKYDIIGSVEAQEDRQRLLNALNGPSIYDAAIHYIANTVRMTGVKPRSTTAYSEKYTKDIRVFTAWEYVYNNRTEVPELYQLGEKLVDLEDAFRRWRFRHLGTVARVIGSNTGTGGSTGLRYLRAVANQLIDEPMYPELWDVRNKMFNPEGFDEKRAGYRT